MIDKILLTSLELGRVITIIYQSSDGSITKRSISVISIEGDKVTAHCYLRNQTRVFRKNNILAAGYCRDYVSVHS